MTADRDVRDLTRSWLASRQLDSFYATLYPQNPRTNAWEPVSILSDEDIRRVRLALHLRRRYGLRYVTDTTEDYMRLVVSREGIGRVQAIDTHIGEAKAKRRWFDRIWPFGHKENGGNE